MVKFENIWLRKSESIIWYKKNHSSLVIQLVRIGKIRDNLLMQLSKSQLSNDSNDVIRILRNGFSKISDTRSQR